MLLHEEQSGRFLRRPQQAYPAATVADYCAAVLSFIFKLSRIKALSAVFYLCVRKCSSELRWVTAPTLQSGRSLRHAVSLVIKFEIDPLNRHLDLA
jgi:hypothetical protein